MRTGSAVVGASELVMASWLMRSYSLVYLVDADGQGPQPRTTKHVERESACYLSAWFRESVSWCCGRVVVESSCSCTLGWFYGSQAIYLNAAHSAVRTAAVRARVPFELACHDTTREMIIGDPACAKALNSQQ